MTESTNTIPNYAASSDWQLMKESVTSKGISFSRSVSQDESSRLCNSKLYMQISIIHANLIASLHALLYMFTNDV